MATPQKIHPKRKGPSAAGATVQSTTEGSRTLGHPTTPHSMEPPSPRVFWVVNEYGEVSRADNFFNVFLFPKRIK
jgi:hypothetical protein